LHKEQGAEDDEEHTDPRQARPLVLVRAPPEGPAAKGGIARRTLIAHPFPPSIPPAAPNGPAALVWESTTARSGESVQETTPPPRAASMAAGIVDGEWTRRRRHRALHPWPPESSTVSQREDAAGGCDSRLS